MDVGLAHPAAEQDQRMIQQRAVAVRRLTESLEELGEQRHVVGVDLHEVLDVLRELEVMRHRVVRLGDAQVGIRDHAGVLRQHEAQDARDVGLVGQRRQLEHQACMLFPRLGNAERRVHLLQRALALLLRRLDAALYLANVVQVLVQPAHVSSAEPVLEVLHVVGQRIQDALVGLHSLLPLGGRARPAEHSLEHDARVDFHRHRCGRRRPRDRVHVRAAVLRVAPADVTGEVLGGELERRQRRLLSDLAGDHLIERLAAVDVLGECLLRQRTAQPGRHGHRVPVDRVAHLRDDRDVLAELLDGPQDGRELEVEEDLARVLKGKTVYIVGADPVADDPKLAKALEGAEFVAVQDVMETATTEIADVVLPAQPFTEREGTLTSGERRVQRFYPAVPVTGDAKADFSITSQIARHMNVVLEGTSVSAVFDILAASVKSFEGLDYAKLAEVKQQWPIVGRGDVYYGGTTYENTQGMGVHLSVAVTRGEKVSIPKVQEEAVARPKENELLAVPVTKLYDRGTTVLPAELLHERIGDASVVLHPDAAKNLGVEAGQTVNVSFNGVSGEAVVKLDDTISVGVALIPRSMGLAIREPVAVKVK